MGYPIPVLQFFNEPHCHGRSIWVLLQFWQLLLTSQITETWLKSRGLAIQWYGNEMCFYGCDIREMRIALSLHAVADSAVFPIVKVSSSFKLKREEMREVNVGA